MDPEIGAPRENSTPADREDVIHVPVQGKDGFANARLSGYAPFSSGAAGLLFGLASGFLLGQLYSEKNASNSVSPLTTAALPETIPGQQAHVRNIALQLRLALLPHNMDSVSVLRLQRLEGELKALTPAEIARCRNIFDQANASGERVSDIAIDWLDTYRGQEKTARRECVENILTILGYDTRKNLVEL